ncbi:MAG: hypothetical protein NT010_00700 [Proteobacteria bacterium]|nr:hypothetical protein [Pseudomonadota bacterium]
MKKIIIIMLALFLAVPAITYAGSATSRWDVTIGGYIEFETGYNTQNIGSALLAAQRTGYMSNQNMPDETGNFFMSAAQTELNFLIKGPDAWGAKTMAFLSGDFTGQWAAVNAGSFDMKFAFMKLMWPSSSLTIGQLPSPTSTMPTWSGNAFNFSTVTAYNKGTPNTQQIMFNQMFGKNWAINIGVINSGNMNGGGPGGAPAGANLSGMPFLAGDITWSTDSCGTVGPWKMLFSTGGFIGKTRTQYISQASTATTVQKISDKNLTSWLWEAKAIIPVIPQKKENKAGAFLAAFSVFTGQNTGNQLNFAPNSGGFAYAYGNAITADIAAPTISGGYAHLQYYLTNNVFVNGFYGYMVQNWSQAQSPSAAAAAGLAEIRNNQQITANIMYDVSPALRVGFEYINVYTRYANLANIANANFYDTKGINHSFRIGAIYFF